MSRAGIPGLQSREDVKYGNQSVCVWPWLEQYETGLDHVNAGPAPAWHEELTGEGGASCTALAYVFTGLAWWRLRPAPEMVAAPAPDPVGVRRVVAACADDASFALVYLPHGGSVQLRAAEIAGLRRAHWCDPRTGRQTPAEPAAAGDAPTDESGPVYQAPSEQDWLLLFQ